MCYALDHDHNFIKVSSAQRIFLHVTKSNLSFLSLNVTISLHFVVNPLCLHSWRCLWIVDLTGLNFVKVFCFAMEIILPSSTLAIFCSFPGLLMVLSSPVRSSQKGVKCQLNARNKLLTFYLHHLSWNLGTHHTCPWNCLSVNCLCTFAPENGGILCKIAVINKW